MSRPMTASGFVSELLKKNPPELFYAEGEGHVDPRVLPGEAMQFVDFPVRTGFMKVDNLPRPLQILADEGKTWLLFRYHRRTKRVASANLIAEVARTLNAIAVHSGPSYWQREAAREKPANRATRDPFDLFDLGSGR